MLICRCLALDSNLLACLERISLCGISFSRYQILPPFLGLIIFSLFSLVSLYSHYFPWSHYILIIFLGLIIFSFFFLVSLYSHSFPWSHNILILFLGLLLFPGCVRLQSIGSWTATQCQCVPHSLSQVYQLGLILFERALLFVSSFPL